MSEHWQACFDVQTRRCVCPIENKDARIREAAPEMREMLLKLEWVDYDDIEVCPICGASKEDNWDYEKQCVLPPKHINACALGALLERLR